MTLLKPMHESRLREYCNPDLPIGNLLRLIRYVLEVCYALSNFIFFILEPDSRGAPSHIDIVCLELNESS